MSSAGGGGGGGDSIGGGSGGGGGSKRKAEPTPLRVPDDVLGVKRLFEVLPITEGKSRGYHSQENGCEDFYT